MDDFFDWSSIEIRWSAHPDVLGYLLRLKAQRSISPRLAALLTQSVAVEALSGVNGSLLPATFQLQAGSGTEGGDLGQMVLTFADRRFAAERALAFARAYEEMVRRVADQVDGDAAEDASVLSSWTSSFKAAEVTPGVMAGYSE